MNVLLTGASASGKTTYGGALAARLPAPRYLIDTARPDPFDAARPLWRARMQAEGFTVFEWDTALGARTLPARGTVLLDCLCHLTANEMFDAAGRASDPFRPVVDGVAALFAQCAHIIVITNEVGCGTAAELSPGSRRYVEALGKINNALAAQMDNVCEMVCGIPLMLKGERI